MDTLHTCSPANAPRQIRQGLTSHILLQKDDVPETNPAVTWVTVEPGCSQTSHQHAPEQVYVIIHGIGTMRVSGREIVVAKGDLIHVPSNAEHSITNALEGHLTYVSASTPSFDITRFYDDGKA